jgi:predicted SnoaL-like aldol condensation-catalyzing enzyme
VVKTATLFLASVLALSAAAHVPAVVAPNQQKLLVSSNPVIAKNKRLVYEFWRVVIEGGHLELANKYLARSYIQHNPNVPTGRAGFVRFFSQYSKPKPIEASIQAPLVSIVAERDLVILSFVKEHSDPKDPASKYTTTWFDMFRVTNGKIVEHWDSALKQ